MRVDPYLALSALNTLSLLYTWK